MNFLRASLRLLSLFLVLIALFVLWMPGDLLLRTTGRDTISWRANMLRFWGRVAAPIMGLRITVEGTPPQMPFCLVANHLSYVDVLLMQFTTGGILLSKAEVASWPIVGALSARIGTLFIDRTMRRDVVRVNQLIENTLAAGDGIIFFPEGTTGDGKSVRRFNSSLLNYPAQTSYPVHYAAISYSSKHVDPADRICWWADMTFFDHFWKLLQIPSFEATIVFGPESVTEVDRKVLTLTLKQRIEDIFTPSTRRLR